MSCPAVISLPGTDTLQCHLETFLPEKEGATRKVRERQKFHLVEVEAGQSCGGPGGPGGKTPSLKIIQSKTKTVVFGTYPIYQKSKE